MHTRTQRPHRNWAELCLSVFYGATGQQWPATGAGALVHQTWVWHKSSWKRSSLTPLQSCQNLHRTGETDSWRTQTKPCVQQGLGDRSSDPTRNWSRLACEYPWVSSRGVGQQWPATGSGALNASGCAWDLLKEVTISSLLPPMVMMVQVKQQEGDTEVPIDRIILDKKFTVHGPALQNKT